MRINEKRCENDEEEEFGRNKRTKGIKRRLSRRWEIAIFWHNARLSSCKHISMQEEKLFQKEVKIFDSIKFELIARCKNPLRGYEI